MSTARKKPGRPRKRVEMATTFATRGIISAPIVADRDVELVYHQPLILRHLTAIFKAYASEEIVFDFGVEGLELYGIDHSQRIHIHINIAGADMNSYYCRAPVRIIVKRDNLGIVVASIERTHTNVCIALADGDSTVLHMLFNNSEYDNEDAYEIEVVPRDIPIPSEQLSQYPLEFAVDARHLRHKIDELRKVSKQMIVRKLAGRPLEITFGDVARVVHTCSYKSDAKIKLRNEIEQGESFMASVDLDQIRPLMAVNLPGNISIAADVHNPMAFRVGLDPRGGNVVNAAATSAPISSSDVHFAIVIKLVIMVAR